MVRFAKFIGANTDFSTAQAYLFPRVIDGTPGQSVFGLVITCEGEDVFIYVRQKILNLEEAFSAPFERATEKLHELGEMLKASLSKASNLKFSLFCVKDNVFYAYQFGDNIIELLRQGDSTPVFSDAAFQEKVISGFLQPGDRILVLSSKREESKWDPSVLRQVFELAFEEVEDADSIFAVPAKSTETEEDLAGVKNIEPVAFLIIENQIQTDIPLEGAARLSNSYKLQAPKLNIKFKMPSFNLWIHIHRFSRRLFGFTRIINRKVLIAIIVFILFISVGVGGYLVYTGMGIQKNQRVNNLITAIVKDLVEATNLKDSDSKQASEKITLAKGRFQEALGLQKENPKLLELEGRIAAKETEVLKIYKDFNLDLFMSLDLIKDNFLGERFSYSVGEILLLDANEKSLVAVDTKLKTTSIIGGRQQLGNIQFATLNGSHAYSYSPDKGVMHVDIDTRKASIVSEPDPEWGNMVDLFGFSGNVYGLDTGKNQIWKYAPTESGYAQKQEYLKDGTSIGLGKRLVIDYSVWVLTSEPNILKFTGGNSDFYAMSGLLDPLLQIDGFYVPEELDLVFVLDKSTNRILVTKKNGEYQAQYINPEFSKISDFFVDPEQKLIYLLIENKIYTTPLR